MDKKIAFICLLSIFLFAFYACGGKSISNELPVTETEETDFGGRESSFLINAQGDCGAFLSTEEKPNVISDIDTLLWIIPRGGAGITGEGQMVSEKDNIFILESASCLGDYLASGKREWDEGTDSGNVWIRVINEPYLPEEGINEPGHKDIVIYKDGEDAYFALQDPDDEEMWTVWLMPEYGNWIEKEIMMFLRVTTGL